MSEIDLISSAGGSVTIIGVLVLIIRDFIKNKNGNGKTDAKAHARLDEIAEKCSEKHSVLGRELGDTSRRFIGIEKILDVHTDKLDEILTVTKNNKH